MREVTPNATTKDCFYIVDAIGVTEHDKQIPKAGNGKDGQKNKTPKIRTTTNIFLMVMLVMIIWHYCVIIVQL